MPKPLPAHDALWKKAVLEALDTAGIRQERHEANPKQALLDLVQWHVEKAVRDV